MPLRRYRDPDAEATLHVFERAVRVTAVHDYTRAQVEAWAPANRTPAERAAWAQARAAAHTIVAVESDRVAGFADLVGDRLLDMLYVDPAWQRRGIGAALIEEIADLARSRGAPAIETDASITARPVFERHGFRLVAEQRPVVRGVAMTNFRMRLLLDRRHGSVSRTGTGAVTRPTGSPTGADGR